MRRSMMILSCLALTACGPKSKFHDYTTPERAARSFIEAGRVGDSGSVRQSVVAKERDSCGSVDYKDIGEYSITLASLMEDDSAVVTLQSGTLKAPIACRMEKGEWKVTIRGTLDCMQKNFKDLMASAPR
ncbi:MAG: hypothetical protein ACI89X_003969 [Planctomycetota bacterium]|jgi:hypothetical protein